MRRRHLPIIVATALVLALGGLTVFLLVERAERTRVVRVVDGDSFELKDGRRVRLLGLDAPERDRCFGPEAKALLASVTLDKRVRFEHVAKDGYGRQLANVFFDHHFVNELMLLSGASRFSGTASPYAAFLKKAEENAKDAKRGIWSDACRQVSSASACAIKGNRRAGKGTYHLPSCRNYVDTVVDLSFGDRWFCSEPEASAAGFIRATGCP